MSLSTTKQRSGFNSRSRRTHKKSQQFQTRHIGLEALEPRTMLTGTWTPLTNLISGNGGVQRFALLSNGTVIIPRTVSAGQDTQILTPDASGSYVNGTWSDDAAKAALAARQGGTEIVLPDGRLMYFGGEDSTAGTGTEYNNGQIYDPVANTWTAMASFPESTFGNGPAELLANGQVLAGSTSDANTYLYNPATNSWSAGPTKLYGGSSANESWTLLPDGSVLSYDVNGNPGEAQRLDPTTMTWVDAGTVPVPLEAGVSAFQDMGPGVLLPNGQVLELGRSSQTAIYTPPTAGDGTNGVGSWTAGPVIPGGLETGGENDSYGGSTAAVLPNGHVLFTADMPDTGGPTKIFEWDPTAPSASSLTDVTPPFAGYQTNSVDSVTRMLLLPTGQVLLGNAGINPLSGINQLYVYTPDGAPQTAWRPTITSVVASGSNFQLTGTQLTGVTAGASHGTSTQTATNYPIVELKNAAGTVYFARTFDWSSTGVATGSTPETTQFSLPAGMPLGTYSLTVIANGIASAPISFTGGFVGADLAVSLTNAGAATAEEGDWLNYNLSVTNLGPSAATKTVLTDTLGPNLAFAFAIAPQGSIKQSGSVITFSLGTIAAGQTVGGISVIGQALSDGNLINSVSVTSSVSDASLLNNTASVSIPVTDQPIVVSAPITVTGKNQNSITTATFTHWSQLEPDAEPTSDFAATINWGDGSTSTGTVTYTKSSGTYKVIGSHTYATKGPYAVITTVVEAGSGSQAMTALAMVNSNRPASTTVTRSAVAQITPLAVAGSPPTLHPAEVDQVFGATALKHSGRSFHIAAKAVSDATLDKFFALI